MTTDHLFEIAVAASIGVHLVGLAGASSLGLSLSSPPPAEPKPVPIQVVKEAAPEPPPPPKIAKPERTKPRVAPVAQPVRPAPIQPSKLIDERAAIDMPAIPEQKSMTPNATISRPHPVVAGPREGGAAGAGELFSTGNIPVRSGPGTSAGSGAAGQSGSGLASVGNADPVAAAGVTSFAKPLGGYQTVPRYPESARRSGIEGVTTLRFVVEANGHVGTVRVAQSAGNAELDEAAVEAVKTWLFEPARRGKEAVPVWVTLPVRFQLSLR